MPGINNQTTSNINEIQSALSTPTIGLYTLVFTTGIGVFMSVIDGSVVNISLHKITSYFNIDLALSQWVVLSYLLAISALMLLAGDFGDRFGNKKIFQLGLLVFSIASALCSLSFTIEMLVLFRVLQAFGASFIMANGVAIITSLVPKKERGKALGWNSLIVSSGLVVGPMVGGVLTELFGWQSIFLINVPIGVIGYFAVQKNIPTLPPNNKNKDKGVDYLGWVLFAVFVVSGIYSMTLFGSDKTQDYELGLFLILLSIVLFLSFLYHVTHFSHPIIDINLFKNKTFSFSVFSSILAFIMVQFVSLQLPYFLQEINNVTPITASLVMFGFPLMMSLTGPWAGRLSDRIEPKYISTLGVVGIGFVLVIITFFVGTNTNLLILFLLMMLLGFTVGIFASPNSNAIMSSAPKNKQGLAGGMMALARNVGFASGIGFSTSILLFFQNQSKNINGGLTLDAINYVPAFQLMLLVASSLTIITVLFSYLRGSNYTVD
jgi:EmrB/QacA subfamily drug resistance transporter